jgi:hypothetical protein
VKIAKIKRSQRFHGLQYFPFILQDTRNMKMKKRRLLFPLSNELENAGKLRLVEDCVNIAYLMLGSASTELNSLVESRKLTHLGTFLDKNTLYKMVTLEGKLIFLYN